jgi:hypothetical protein
MAILFTTGTINQPDAGSVGLAMIEKLRDDIVAHVAWELVEEFTPASGLVRWYVFKCLAAQSGLPADYFVVIGRTLGSGELRVSICEEYNSSTHVMSKFATMSTSSGHVYDSSGRLPHNYTLATAVFPNSQTTPSHNDWAPSGVSTKYWITVENDGFSVAFNGASNGFFHIGTYTPLCILPVTMPIVQTGSIPASVPTGFITRNPAMASQTYYNTALELERMQDNPLGFSGPRLDHNDALHGGARPVSELGLAVYPGAQGSTADPPVQGRVLGKHKRVRYGVNPPAAVAFGDAYVLQGRLWVPYLPTDGRMWDTGVSV